MGKNPLFLWSFSIAMLNYQRVGWKLMKMMEVDIELLRWCDKIIWNKYWQATAATGSFAVFPS